MDMEYQQLKAEINRIGANTQWNGTNLLDGKGFPGTTKFQVGANASQTIEVEILELSTSNVGVVNSTVIEQVTTTTTTANEVVDSTPWKEISVPDFASSGERLWPNTALSGDGKTLARLVTYTERADIATFQLSGSEWIPKGGLITLPNSEERSPSPSDIDLSADGNLLVAGLPYHGHITGNNYLGGVIAYEFDAQNWVQLGSIMTRDSGTALGLESVVVSGDGRTVATFGGDPSNLVSVSSDGRGIYAFKLSGNDWVETEFASNGSSSKTGFSSIALSNDGSEIAYNTEVRRSYTNSIDQHAFISRYNDTDYPYVYLHGTDAIYKVHYEWDEDFAAHGRLGISSDGMRYVASSPLNDYGTDNGYVIVYEKDSVSGRIVAIKEFRGELDGQEAGYAVAISGDGSTIAYVSRVAIPDDNSSVVNRQPDSGGSIKIFKENGSGWVQQGSTLQILPNARNATNYPLARIELSNNGETLLYWDGNGREIRTWSRDAGETSVTETNDVARANQKSLSGTSVLTQADAQASSQNIDKAVADISSMRATYGATINRLEHAIDGLTNTRINLEASVSRITDTNYAKETAELAKAQIINRASIAMLAQAQMRHEDILTLIRGVVY